jgi:acetylornithine/succinyldiaminopimelate/putrescine aminotransferase
MATRTRASAKRTKAGGRRLYPKRITGKPLTDSIEDFVRRFEVIKELRGRGLIVRVKKTGEFIKVYGDKSGRTIIEPCQYRQHP